ncbi:MAG TPA: hypothetical protein VFC13_10145 [Actinomycetes bacterium]|nr:hypothetical protein [Actinomycetes bacterium]
MAHDDAGPAGQAPECQICPICAGLAALRGARPEVVEHLAKAGVELFLAARALLDGATATGDAPAPSRRGRRRAGTATSGGGAVDGLQRIDVG